ncbi:Mpo1-like protein [Paludisphaera sp.]|uniref:Mpo1-like protein n=1 Tax=Paludisphaera sp. TaxID=2017432 RepID=UPI00301BD28D
MIAPPENPHPLVVHWLQRHRGAICFVLHMVGIPFTILGALLLAVYVFQASFPVFATAVGMFVAGFALQFAGHYLEGTDPGEVIYFKRLFGVPYVEFPPGRGPYGGTTPAPTADAAGESADASGSP